MRLNLRVLRRMLPSANKSITKLRAQADTARDCQAWRDAAQLYRAYLAENPKDFGIWVQCGHAEKESGDFNAALRCYLEGLSLRNDDADIHLQMGHLYKLMDRDNDAIASYRQCLAIDANSPDAMVNLAGLLRATEPPRTYVPLPASATGRAAPEFTIPSSALPSDTALPVLIAQAQRDGNALAVAQLTRARVRLSPHEPWRWRALAQALDQIGDVDQSKRCMMIAKAVEREIDSVASQ